MHDRRALIISDHVLVRERIAELLDRGGYAVTASAKLAGARLRVGVAFVDLDHMPVDVMRLVQLVREHVGDATVVALGTSLRLAATTDGFIDVELESDRADGPALLASAKRRAPAASAELARLHRLWAEITPRQRDVLRWLSIGAENAAIALRLRIGERAVKAHVTALLERFEVDRRTQLALLARDAGLRPTGR